MFRIITEDKLRVLLIIKNELKKLDFNDSIVLDHPDPKVGKSPHRVAWLRKKLKEHIENKQYSDKHSITLNSLRERFIDEIKNEWIKK